MIKRYCDLCGNEIADNTKKRIEIEIRKIDTEAEKNMANVVFGEDVARRQEYDVCLKCSDRLAKFLQGRRKSDVLDLHK